MRFVFCEGCFKSTPQVPNWILEGHLVRARHNFAAAPGPFLAMVPARARHNFAAAPEPPQVSESFLFKFLHDGPGQPPQIPKTTYLLAVRFEFRFPQIPPKQRPNRG